MANGWSKPASGATGHHKRQFMQKRRVSVGSQSESSNGVGRPHKKSRTDQSGDETPKMGQQQKMDGSAAVSSRGTDRPQKEAPKTGGKGIVPNNDQQQKQQQQADKETSVPTEKEKKRLKAKKQRQKAKAQKQQQKEHQTIQANRETLQKNGAMLRLDQDLAHASRKHASQLGQKLEDVKVKKKAVARVVRRRSESPYAHAIHASLFRHLVHIQATFNGFSVVVFLDGGSMISICSVAFWKKCGFRAKFGAKFDANAVRTIIGVDKKESQTIGRIRGAVFQTTDEIIHKHDFDVYDAEADVTLGLDFMIAFKVDIIHSREVVRFGGETGPEFPFVKRSVNQ